MIEPAPKVPIATLLSETTPAGITRKLVVEAAYDFRSHPRNYGIHGMVLSFSVSRDKHVVELAIHTGIMLEGIKNSLPYANSATHSPRPHYEGQQNVGPCDYTGGDCFCSTSGLYGEKQLNAFIADPGSLWKTLEQDLIDLETASDKDAADERRYS